MIALPWSLWLKIAKPDGRVFRVWLPLFLLWLIVLPLVALAFVITALVDVALFVAGESYHHYSLLLYRCLALLGDVRGMTVNVNAEKTVVEISIR